MVLTKDQDSDVFDSKLLEIVDINKRMITLETPDSKRFIAPISILPDNYEQLPKNLKLKLIASLKDDIIIDRHKRLESLIN